MSNRQANPRPLSTINDINLARGIARHEQPPFLVKVQPDRAEAAVGAGTNVAVLHDGDLGRLAGDAVHGLPVLEIDARDAVAVGRVAVPDLWCQLDLK